VQHWRPMLFIPDTSCHNTLPPEFRPHTAYKHLVFRIRPLAMMFLSIGDVPCDTAQHESVTCVRFIIENH
jgi:hypothetical protein